MVIYMGYDLGVPLSRTNCEGEFRGTRKILRHSKYNSLLADANKIRQRTDYQWTDKRKEENSSHDVIVRWQN